MAAHALRAEVARVWTVRPGLERRPQFKVDVISTLLSRNGIVFGASGCDGPAHIPGLLRYQDEAPDLGQDLALGRGRVAGPGRNQSSIQPPQRRDHRRNTLSEQDGCLGLCSCLPRGRIDALCK